MMRYISVILATLMTLLQLTACGGGGGGGPATNTITGVASKGIIQNGTIRVYALNADGNKGALLMETTTDANGAYTAPIGTYIGAILVEASGTYIDEATGTAASITAGAPLRAALASVSGTVTVAVTPLTELAVQRIENPVSKALDVPGIAASNAAVSGIFLTDIIKALPVDALTDTPTATQQQKEYALLLAAVSRLMLTEGKDLQAVISELKAAVTPDNKLAVSTAAAFQAALAAFAQSASNKTGITNISATPLVNIGGSTKVLTLSVTGASTPIAGIGTTISLPPGVTVKADANGKVLDSALTISGQVATTSQIAGKYTPATASTRGTVRLALVSTQGVTAGEFATLHCDIAPDAAPALADFVILGLQTLDNTGTTIDNVTLNLALQ